MASDASRSGDRASTAATGTIFTYESGRGVLYYLHQGKTKTGAPRYYFARAVGDGVLASLPRGFEVVESLNGVVSVRRTPVGPQPVPAADVERVREVLQGHAHLRGCRVETRKNEIVVYEPEGVDLRGFGPSDLPFPHALRSLPARYVPVMKFVRALRQGPDHYAVHRMTYRGDGGWSYPLSSGPLQKLLAEYLRHIGRESFYELC